MKKIFLFLLLLFCTGHVFGQACGVYLLNFKGEVSSDSINIKALKLPNTYLLENKEGCWSKADCYTTHLYNNQYIDILSYSHLTSVFTNANYLSEHYKSNRQGLPIIFIVDKKGKLVKIPKEIPWDKIAISEGYINKNQKAFILDFGSIKI